jgi:hypothetical protein
MRVSPQINVAYNVVFILKVCVIFLHGGVDGLKGRHQVVEDCGAPCLAFWLSESASVDDAHLLEDRRLATLTSTYRPGLAGVRVKASIAPYRAAAASPPALPFSCRRGGFSQYPHSS